MTPRKESRELSAARRHLAAAETDFRSADGLADLVEGLAFVEDLIDAGAASEAHTAENLAATYAARFHERISAVLEHDRAVTEPELEHFFKLVLAFDRVASVLPADTRSLKVALVRRLIDRYCEGHPPEKKRSMLAALDTVAGDS